MLVLYAPATLRMDCYEPMFTANCPADLSPKLLAFISTSRPIEHGQIIYLSAKYRTGF